ncbi:hypothetical protein HV819_08660 [Anaerococcus sp. AGMB00486]|uniref:Uncharacterized protein n=2 Tax=Anaerococcus TaxID=165779 RepID=A0ABX2NBH4_9FIRM|nr:MULTISPECIES: hypothetical protein [Anaerococcus]MDY3005606.1 hypothetical protein [Anaerococcus porci]MSS78150.1 hypothetical protein [Anaerococcus porci]NVF12046.1 hypothetical protein [Anaerococcus faecalis]
MGKRFEKTLSFLLLLSILLLLIGPILINFININTDLYDKAWNLSLLLSWILMFIYGLYILMEKNSRSFSIFVAIVTVLAFIILSYHAIIVAGKYIAVIPKYIAVEERLVTMGQQVFYTALIVVYIVHIINLILLGRYKSNDDGLNKKEQ